MDSLADYFQKKLDLAYQDILLDVFILLDDNKMKSTEEAFKLYYRHFGRVSVYHTRKRMMEEYNKFKNKL